MLILDRKKEQEKEKEKWTVEKYECLVRSMVDVEGDTRRSKRQTCSEKRLNERQIRLTLCPKSRQIDKFVVDPHIEYSRLILQSRPETSIRFHLEPDQICSNLI